MAALRVPFFPCDPPQLGGGIPGERGLAPAPAPQVLGCQGAPALHPGNAGGRWGGLLQRLGQWFYEVDVVTAWGERLWQHWLRRHQLRSRNACVGLGRGCVWDNVVAAVFTLSCGGGGVRFEGQEHWIWLESCWCPEVLHLHDVPVVALDLSSSPLTYNGLDNLVPLTWLQHLDLSGCPHLDNWALGRLHIFRDSLRELSVARCPHVTERGLATLHHLQELWQLDVAGVQAPSPGLVRILLEEMLPDPGHGPRGQRRDGDTDTIRRGKAPCLRLTGFWGAEGATSSPRPGELNAWWLRAASPPSVDLGFFGSDQ
ncbi:distal membrane-arm assembly complex protein 2 [Haliaeetus albicilla]|uniref:distal membrane-arm assembly complex protein 2 n=1 Tax=Haliaeetus albicilla TaxID=8969 RepID=UPI0037E76FC0